MNDLELTEVFARWKESGCDLAQRDRLYHATKRSYAWINTEEFDAIFDRITEPASARDIMANEYPKVIQEAFGYESVNTNCVPTSIQLVTHAIKR